MSFLLPPLSYQQMLSTEISLWGHVLFNQAPLCLIPTCADSAPQASPILCSHLHFTLPFLLLLSSILHFFSSSSIIYFILLFAIFLSPSLLPISP